MPSTSPYHRLSGALRAAVAVARRDRHRAGVLIAVLTALLAVAMQLAVAAPAVAAPTQPGAGGATFGLGPANAKGIDGRPYLTYLSAPGAVLTDHVAVVNLDTKRVTLNLYTVDATVTPDGKFGYLAHDAARRDASSWISLDTPRNKSTITLGPRATAIVPISIHIPSDAEPGDHAAGVVTSLTSKVTDDQGKQIDFEQRVALRTFIRLSGALRPQLAIQDLHVRYRGTANPFGRGEATLTYTVRNLGNVRLGARQQVSVSGLIGTARPAHAPADIPLLLPGTAVRVSLTVPGVLPQGPLTARVRLFPLTVVGDVDPSLPPHFDASARFWAVPWALLAALGGLVLATAAWLLWRRRRRRSGKTASGRHHRTSGRGGAEQTTEAREEQVVGS